MTRSLSQEEELSDQNERKWRKNKEEQRRTKKVEEASSIRGGVEILNSLPIFQANFPSKSHESTSKQQTQPSSLQVSDQPISIPNLMPVQSAPLMVTQMPSMPNQLSDQCISAPLIQPPIPSIAQPPSQVSPPSIPQANNQAPATYIPQPASQVSMPSISQSTSQQPSPPSSPPPNQLRLRSPSPFHQLPHGQSSPTRPAA